VQATTLILGKEMHVYVVVGWVLALFNPARVKEAFSLIGFLENFLSKFQSIELGFLIFFSRNFLKFGHGMREKGAEAKCADK
jgi:hypothetical protein